MNKRHKNNSHQQRYIKNGLDQSPLCLIEYLNNKSFECGLVEIIEELCSNKYDLSMYSLIQELLKKENKRSENLHSILKGRYQRFYYSQGEKQSFQIVWCFILVQRLKMYNKLIECNNLKALIQQTYFQYPRYDASKSMPTTINKSKLQLLWYINNNALSISFLHFDYRQRLLRCIANISESVDVTQIKQLAEFVRFDDSLNPEKITPCVCADNFIINQCSAEQMIICQNNPQNSLDRRPFDSTAETLDSSQSKKKCFQEIPIDMTVKKQSDLLNDTNNTKSEQWRNQVDSKLTALGIKIEHKIQVQSLNDDN